MIDFDCRLKSDENERYLAKKEDCYLAKSKAIALVFCSKMTKCETKSDENEYWQKGKAIALVFADQIWDWLIVIADWKVMKMSDFWQERRL